MKKIERLADFDHPLVAETARRPTGGGFCGLGPAAPSLETND